ncbi:Double-strand-break repair protein rad21-like protein 1 [Astathelohania contejeani]|uniref:Double-strand-break repair protein rad21-like protein 1 n=1 Tax=Astathelohania contejeani TaxID=164912 RepID=A0ABQ7I1C5_9MICR|nr:Double-strand-break repair protein rad21-like protein 1 [Thelohania contejeani]
MKKADIIIYNKIPMRKFSEDIQIYIIWQAGHREKKLTKTQIQTINLNEVLKKIQELDISLRQSSRLMLGLVFVLVKQIKYIEEDVQGVNNGLVRKPKIVKMGVNKGITLRIPESDIYIDDNMLEEDVNMEIERNNDTGLEIEMNSFYEDSFEPTQINLNSLFIEKRRKILSDDKIEIDPKEYKTEKASRKEVAQRNELVNNWMERLNIAPEILEKIEHNISASHRMSIEVGRGDSFEVEYERNAEVDWNDETYLNSEGNISITESMIFPREEFVFNDLVASLSKLQKATEFLHLLKMASENRWEVKQNDSFGAITCKVIN